MRLRRREPAATAVLEPMTDVEVDRGAFGAILRRLRLEARMSQEELAERARLSGESISALERGRRRAPYRETIRMLSDGLRLSDDQRRELESAAQRPRAATVGVLAYDSVDETPPPAGAPIDVAQTRQNLPLQRTSLVGRETDIANIARIVLHDRLVTVTGAGGMGKTRTAIAVADILLERVPAGVWLIELAPVLETSSVAAAVAGALNVQVSSSRPILETLVAHLKHKQLLLLLDNCEHVIAEAASLADTLLHGCPLLRILATSRESLRISGERTYRLPSLRVPTAQQAFGLSRADAMAYGAVALFAQRAQRSDHGFVLGDDNAPLVAEICRRLDGIPLAIELAAARVNVLSLRALATRLDQRLRLLNNGDRTALPRHQTMRALIDWSYDLLDPAEQRLFEQLSIFAGGCTLAAAAAVHAEDVVDELGVLELLSSLVDKSLVVADLDVPEPRYRLLESSRQYADEKLAARGETMLIAYRHARAYVELAERLEREHDVAPDSLWFARAQLEIENWRAALHWTLVQHGDPVLGQRLAGAMRAVWLAFSVAEGRRWQRAALESVDAQTPPLVAADLEYAVASVAYMYCEFETALGGCRRLIDVYQELGDPVGAARAQFIAGRSLANLGRLDEGEPLIVRALDAARALGNAPLTGFALAGLARARSSTGAHAEARAYLAEAFAIYDAIGAQGYPAVALSTAAGVEFRAGDIERAVELSTTSLTALRNFGFLLFVTMELNYLATYLMASGRWDEARTRAREALVLAQATEQYVEVLWALQHLAAATALSNPQSGGTSARLEIAARLIGFVDARLAALDTPRQNLRKRDYQHVLTVLRESLGGASLEIVLSTGAALTQDQAIESARLL
jgi:predicted ATPase/transcriptional regulator with XRE-family HTH domain